MKFRSLITEMPMKFGGFTKAGDIANYTNVAGQEAQVLKRASETPENLAAFRRRVDYASSPISFMPIFVTWKVFDSSQEAGNIKGVQARKKLNQYFPQWREYNLELRQQYGRNKVIVHYIDSMFGNEHYATIDFMWLHRLSHVILETKPSWKTFYKKELSQKRRLEYFVKENLGISQDDYYVYLLPIAPKTRKNFNDKEHLHDMFRFYYLNGKIKLNLARFLKSLKEDLPEDFVIPEEFINKIKETIVMSETMYNKYYENAFRDLTASDGSTYFYGF